MSTPTAKRRRLDVSNVTLSKPFRSPFKNGLPAAALLDPSSSPHRTSRSVRACPDLGPKSLANAPRSLSHRPVQETASPSGAVDPTVATLQKEQRALEQELKESQAQLDTLRQAKKIETDGKIDNLGQLKGKWVAVAREVVEEMFSEVRDRVNRMGGPGAWRNMQQKSAEWPSQGFDDPHVTKVDNDDGEGHDAEKRDLYAEYDIERKKEEEDRRAGEDITDEDEAFTMDMMLKSLNIDLDLVGWDKEQQRWVD